MTTRDTGAADGGGIVNAVNSNPALVARAEAADAAVREAKEILDMIDDQPEGQFKTDIAKAARRILEMHVEAQAVRS